MAAWLVTGGSGFLGRHLLDLLKARCAADIEPIALGRRLPPGWPAGAFIVADLDDPGATNRAIALAQPEVVFHLAGRMVPATPEEMYRGNTLATVHLLDALRALDRPVRLVIAGSAAELGPVPDGDLPVDETWPCKPAGAYGLSKHLASVAGLAAGPPLQVIVARIFNPIGPGMPASLAFGRLARELTANGPIRLKAGGLEVRRDFIDARDVALALLALALHATADRVYHVGTGQSRSIGEGLRHLIARSGREVVVEPDGMEPRGPLDSRADIGRIAAETGWHPSISFERSLDDLWGSLCAGPGCD
ncbi:NAD(P)-dependent oxidoreductase [Isosphaeraceae bacterium EP7]